MKIIPRIRKTFISAMIFLAICFYLEPTRGSISMVTLTPAAPTNMSTGMAYYLAGVTYNFDVRVVDPAATAWGDITLVHLVIPNTQNVDVQVGPLTGLGAHAVTDNNAAANVNVTATVLAGSTFTDCTVRFAVTFRWDTPESAFTPASVVSAEADSLTTAGTITDTVTLSYGVCSSIQWVNPAQDGVAVDGWVNTNFTNFNVTGTLAYNIPGATATDDIQTISGDIDLTVGSEPELIRTLSVAPFTVFPTTLRDATPSPNFSYLVTSAHLVPNADSYNWTIRVNMTTGAAVEDTVNSLAIRCDEVEITDVQFIGGGGVGTGGVGARNYYRSKNLAGTQVRVFARMRYAGVNMVGNTTFTVRDVGSVQDYVVTILNGQNFGDAVIAPLANITPPAGGVNDITVPHQYQVRLITGGVTDSDQDTVPEIYQPGNGFGSYTVVNWENIDPPGLPGADIPFTAMGASTQTASSFTLNWTALSTLCAVGGDPCNGDWRTPPVLGGGTYRIYYKKSTDPLWISIDSSTAGYLAILGDITATTADITGLEPLTNYDWKLSAVDIFGNEVAGVVGLGGNQPTGVVTTQASQTIMTLSDGISKYDDSSFNTQATTNPNVTHKVRKVNLRVIAKVITAGNNPDTVTIVVADNASDVANAAAPHNQPQWGTGAIDNVDDAALVLNTSKFYYSMLKTGSNTWEGYIPGDCPLMVVGNTLRYNLKVTFKGVPTYVDHDADYDPNELVPPGVATDYEWRFYVEKMINTQPWPTKILNNVLTKNSPVCYPAYYLTEDANVTIKIYDVLGRPIATLLDNAFRKGGENIKDQGWAGITKAGKKVGPGLYYIHIKAESLSGNTILNKFNKVAVAW